MSEKSITSPKNDSVVSTISSTEHNQQPKQSNNLVKKSDHKSPSKSRVYKQTYRTAWESVPYFKGWLKAVPGEPSRAHCIVCDRSLHAHRLNLLKHTCTLRHIKAARERYNQSKEATNEYETGKDKDSKNEIDKIEVAADSLDNGNNSDDEINSSQATPEPPAPPCPKPQSVFKPDSQPPISTHVFDTAKGMPITGLQVSLYKLVDGRWTHLNEGLTNPVGRCEDLISRTDLKPGRFKLHFDTDRYFNLRNQDTIFPFIEIVFDVRSPLEHYHIPLLLSPYGYTTYRGSNA